MRVRDIMSTPVGTCAPSHNLASISAIMWKHDCGIVPVIEDGDRVVGVVTDRDICIALGTRSKRASEITADEVMSKRLHICGPDDDPGIALDTMAAARVRRLPVVSKQGKLEGILSINDLIRRAGSAGAPPPGNVMNVLKAISEKEHRVQEAHAAR